MARVGDGYTPIHMSRMFPGWEQLRDRYHRPGIDGDIFVWVPKEGWGDAADAQLIIDFLQQKGDFAPPDDDLGR